MDSDCDRNCESCAEDCAERKKDEQGHGTPLPAHSRIGRVIGVVSGKGGVGKSLVTSLLAVAMNRLGHRVGILDADITGPSIPRAFGLRGKAFGSTAGIFPATSKEGILIMSVNLLLENETDPVVWRGPLIGNTVRSFWTDVIWGDLDILFIDMPPGTGDVPLTVFREIPVDGLIVVASPQELVAMIVAKAVRMAEMMEIPIIGLVENMSYFVCPDTGKEHPLFGESHIGEVAEKHRLALLARIPVDPKLSEACDRGEIESFRGFGFDALEEALLGRGRER